MYLSILNYKTMKNGYYILLLAMIPFLSCKQEFKKGQKGMEYMVIETGSGPKIKNGQFMQMHICQIANDGKKDSVLNDTRKTSGPVIEPFNSNTIPPEYYKIISLLRKGDSLVLRILTDSMFAANPAAMPSFFKKGCYFTTTIKLLNIFKDSKEAELVKLQDRMEAQKRDSIDNIEIFAKQDKELQEYFNKNKLTPTKLSSGVYVQIVKQGSGANIDTSVIVKTNYTGMTLDGFVFDSNTDSSKGHVEPFNVNMTNDRSYGGGVIKGWKDGLASLNKGAIAKLFIPSPLAYGKQGAGEDIKPNSILVFDIEILDVMSKEKVKSEMEAKRKKMMLNKK